MKSMSVALWWIRRDLRLRDNPALCAAMEARHVVPLFILDPLLLNSPYHRQAHKRLSFLFDGLRGLDHDLRERGSRLIVRTGEPVAVLDQLQAETNFAAVFAAEDFSPYGRQRDARVAQHYPLTLTSGALVHHPAHVVKADGQPYTVFTPFSRAWKARPLPSPSALLPAPQRLPAPPAGLASQPIPEADSPAYFLPGEAVAQDALRLFTQGGGAGIWDYAERRNRMDLDGTSALSPYLRFGMLSPRETVVAARQAQLDARQAVARDGADAWLNELIWREFYTAILYHFPQVQHGAFRTRFQQVPWINDPACFEAWCAGRTGYPVVDAAMRQLVTTGWMHNRARMIVASFLVKSLLIDWRWGERFFMQHLVDGDVAINNGGWQWTAGVGTDAAPYFRVFNPTLQAQRFDPRGDYAQTWVRELQGVDPDHIHEPWTMTAAEQHRARCVIGTDYPAPLVEHAFARARVLEAYRQADLHA